MARKKINNEDFTPDIPQEIPQAEGEFGAYKIEVDFNIDEEYKPLPLIPQGTYTGHVTSVKIIPEDPSICWDVTLQGNGGTKSDGSEIDGSTLSFKNWLPKPGDETKRTKSGLQTVREAKISFLKEFSERMKINMNTAQIVQEAIANQDWVGMEVRVKIGIREYEGRYSNNIEMMEAAE